MQEYFSTIKYHRSHSKGIFKGIPETWVSKNHCSPSLQNLNIS